MIGFSLALIRMTRLAGVQTTGIIVLLAWMSCWSPAQAQVQPVSVRIPQTTAWVGQRVPLFIELHAKGSFAGTASFNLPQIPSTLIIKIGNPTVSSEEIEDETWFYQTHEFAVFSQRPGKLEIPSFSVRFANRDGFVGDAHDRNELVPAVEFEIKRPPGTENLGFLITTESYHVDETWDPVPGVAKVGDIFKRTITQRATRLSGMALAPASTKVPAGIRVYANDAQTLDQTDRGSLVGTRTETITYLLTQPGTESLPAVKYVWWNPNDDTLESTTLPPVEFIVAPAPSTSSSENVSDSSPTTPWFFVWITGALATVLIFLSRRRIALAIQQMAHWLNPPDRIAARALIRASRTDDPVSANRAWNQWRNTQSTDYRPSPRLEAAVTSMAQHVFGLQSINVDWLGQELASAFRAERSLRRVVANESEMSLPRLNP